MTTTLLDHAKDDPDRATVEPAAGRNPGRSALAGVLVIVAVGAALALFIGIITAQDPAPAVAAKVVIVPVDTAQSMTEPGDDLLPALLRLQPGKELILENQDWGTHTVGSLTAESGKTGRITYPTEGRYIGTTSLRRDGRITVLVEDLTP